VRELRIELRELRHRVDALTALEATVSEMLTREKIATAVADKIQENRASLFTRWEKGLAATVGICSIVSAVVGTLAIAGVFSS
jgi:hypothetical protein